MSDQQLVTGLAIMISGYSQIWPGLSFYHWLIITNLVLFSCTTHLATLMCLQRYFQQHRYIWYARVILIIGLALMLMIGIIFTGSYQVSLFVSAGGYHREYPLALKAAYIPVACVFNMGGPL